MTTSAVIPPYDLDAENALLGGFLLAGRPLFDRLRPRLEAADFYQGAHRVIYEAMMDLADGDQPIDVVTEGSVLRASGRLEAAGGSAKLAQLLEHGSIAAYADAYAQSILEASAKRQLMAMADHLQHVAVNGTKPAVLISEIEHASTALTIIAARGKAPGPHTRLTIGLAEFFAIQALEPDPLPLIEGILSADGAGWIAGEEKLGKTPYALEEAICLALAAPVCGQFAVPERQRIMFFCEEDTRRRTFKRSRAIIRGKGLDPDDPRLELDEWFRLAVWSGIRLDDPAMLTQLDAEHAAFRPAVTYYDSLRKITRRDLNKAHEAEAFLDALDELRRKYGTLARVIAHNRKISAGGFRTGRGSQEIAGSHVLGAWGECSLFFEPIGRKQNPVRVTVQSKDWAPLSPFRLVIESTGPAYDPITLTLRVEEDRGDEADDLMAQAVATLPTTEAVAGKPGVTVHALAQHLKRSEKTIRRALGRLEDAGRVVVTGKASKQKDLYGVPGE